MATETVILSCARITDPDVAVIDRLARLQLGLRRAGYACRLAERDEELRALIELAGLTDVLGAGVLGVEVQGKPEEREEPGGVQEEGELTDPTA
jgi:hypothetical protein